MFAPVLLSPLYFESGDLFQPGYPTPQSAEDDWPPSLERWACPAVIVTVVHRCMVSIVRWFWQKWFILF